MEKRRKIALNGENMPDDVYKILDEKAKMRSLTPYIVELVQERNKYEELLREMQSIKNMLSRGVMINPSPSEEKKSEEPKAPRSIKVGKITNAKEIRSTVVIDDEPMDF